MLGVSEEARFFGIDSLIEHLELAIKVMLIFVSDYFLIICPCFGFYVTSWALCDILCPGNVSVS